MSYTRGDRAETERHWESGDHAVSKLVLTEGDYTKDAPRFGAKVELKLDEDHDFQEHEGDMDFVVTDNKLEILLGFAVTDLDQSLEKAVMSMFPGEVSRFDVSYTTTNTFEWKTCHFVAHLEAVESTKPTFYWTTEEKLIMAQDLYDKAVDFVKKDRVSFAFELFRRSVTLCKFVDAKNVEGENESVLSQVKELQTKCLSNMSLCQHKNENSEHVVNVVSYIFENCDNSKNNVKLLFRRGNAHYSLGNHMEAMEDLTAALKIDPSNTQVQVSLQKAKTAEKSHNQQMASAMKKMFS